MEHTQPQTAASVHALQRRAARQFGRNTSGNHGNQIKISAQGKVYDVYTIFQTIGKGYVGETLNKTRK